MGFFCLVRVAVGEQRLLLGQCDGETRAGGPQLPPCIAVCGCVVFESPCCTQPHPWAREHFLVWVASWHLPKRGLSASVHPLSPATGLNSVDRVLISINSIKRRCILFHLPPPAQLAPTVQSWPLGSGVNLWAEQQQSHSPSKQEA